MTLPSLPVVPNASMSITGSNVRGMQIRAIRPSHALIGLMFVGFLLLLGAIPLGILTFTPPVGTNQGREVGYGAAINWSLNYGLLFPIAAYLMLSSLQAVSRSLERMDGCGMIRDSRDLTIERSATELRAAWETDSRGTKAMIRVAIALALLIALGEWIYGNLIPLITGSLAGREEIDWGLGALVRNGGAIARLANGVFDLVAFLLEAALIASMLSFLILMFDFGNLSEYSRRYSVQLIPDLTSEDPRRGFQVFEAPLRRLVYVSFVAFLMAYATRLQNLYLRDLDTNNIWQFIHNDVVAGFTAELTGKGAGEKLAQLFSNAFTPTLHDRPLATSLNFSEVAVVFGMFAVAVTVFVVVSDTARNAAREACDAAKAHYDHGGAPLYPATPGDAKQILKTMDVWPIRYLSLNLLICLSIAAAATLFFYRLGLITAGAVLAMAILRAIVEIRRSLQGTQRPVSEATS